jgi:transposase, IS5 family
MKQLGLFGLSKSLKDLSEKGDPLEKLKEIVNFELFRDELERGLNLSEGLKGGRPPHDAVLIFKILILQTLYNLSDDQIEYQIQDRLSFMRFLGLHLSDKVPDAKTIWLYRERFSKNGLIDRLFSRFGEILVNQGYLAMGEQIVDASIVQAPRQRMTKEEKEQIKKGEIPTDCRFSFIRKSEVTAANAYDGHLLASLLDLENTSRDVYGDTAYSTEDNLNYLGSHGFCSKLHRKKPKKKPMPIPLKRSNTTKSEIRAHGEHVFAVQKQQMGLFVRIIGLKRAKVKIGLANITYNIKRFIFFEKRKLAAG